MIAVGFDWERVFDRRCEDKAVGFDWERFFDRGRGFFIFFCKNDPDLHYKIITLRFFAPKSRLTDAKWTLK